MWKLYAFRGGLVIGLGLVVYSFFGMNIGYQPAFRHVQDIWTSEIVQEKFAVVETEIKDIFSGSITKAQKEQKKLAQKQTVRKRESITEDDRKSLDKLITNIAN